MSPDAELMLIFGTLHLIAVALGALLFVMFLRSEATKPWQPPDEDEGGAAAATTACRSARPRAHRPADCRCPTRCPPVRLRSHERLRDLTPRRCAARRASRRRSAARALGAVEEQAVRPGRPGLEPGAARG